MARLGMLYAVTSDELKQLQGQKKEDMYEYLLEEIEEEYYGTGFACELDKAWEGIHWCINKGQWVEENTTPANVIFGGITLLDYKDYVITLKGNDEIKTIISYLKTHDLQNEIEENFDKIAEKDYSLPKNEDNIVYLKDYSKNILNFYEYAHKNNRNVIFSVDI